MTEPRPLLAFGTPSSGPIPKARPGFVPPPRSPSPQRQGQRITPQFRALADALDSGRAEAAESTTEADPELVAVFDLAGTVDGFMRAVRDIAGLEFLAELDDEPYDANEDFYIVDREGTPLDQQVPETLYMVMTNAQAVAELVRLFGLWQADPSVTFDRGLAPLKIAFALMRSVRRWGPQDRIRETGLLDAWRQDVEIAGMQRMRVEIELWYRGSEEHRRAAEDEIGVLVTAGGGRVLATSSIAAIDYHAVLVDLPRAQVEDVLADGADAIDLLKLDSIMFVAPARPMMVRSLDPVPDPTGLSGLGPVATALPRIALIDGPPMANHEALAGRLIIDDPDDLASRYPSGSQHHGTAMASLICHGDLSDPGEALSTRLYVRPIMQPHEYYQGHETVVPDELLVDLLHRCFVRIFDGDTEHPPSAPSVRIVNISIGDPARIFTRRMSPLAKLLDWLSHRYNVLVLVSAGNHLVATDVSRDQLDDGDALHREVATARYLRARQLGVFSPGEATNVVTVGALHADGATIELSDTVLDAIPLGMPAAYGATGFGYRRSVKPEILMPGGRTLFQRPIATDDGDLTLTEARHGATGPGLLVAAPSTTGALTAVAYTSGTSNATALASRASNEIFDVLSSTAPGPDEFSFPDAQYHPVLAKALLVHAAEWGEIGTTLNQILELEPRRARRDLTQLLGYGAVDPNNVATAARNRVVLVGAGSISADQRNTFVLPLPAGLAATTEWRRLTITLAWLSPINPRSRQHRKARLWFSPPDQQFGVIRTQAVPFATRKGTIQHEILEGHDALAFAVGESVRVQVDCRVDAGKLMTPVRFGLAVSIEMAASVRADIHAQVQQGLHAEVRQQARVAAR